MYQHQITVTLPDDIVHRYSIIEWEERLIADGIIHSDERPLSYGRIAEILAVQLYKYRYVQGILAVDYTCKEETTYTDGGGNTVNTKVPLAVQRQLTVDALGKMAAELLRRPTNVVATGTETADNDPGTLQVGIANYGWERG